MLPGIANPRLNHTTIADPYRGWSGATRGTRVDNQPPRVVNMTTAIRQDAEDMKVLVTTPAPKAVPNAGLNSWARRLVSLSLLADLTEQLGAAESLLRSNTTSLVKVRSPSLDHVLADLATKNLALATRASTQHKPSSNVTAVMASTFTLPQHLQHNRSDAQELTYHRQGTSNHTTANR